MGTKMKDAVEITGFTLQEPSPEEITSATATATALTALRADDGALDLPLGEVGSVRVEPAIVDQLIDLLNYVSSGNMVGFVPASTRVTTYQAASILNVSHQYFMNLLRDGEIQHLPATYVHRVSLVDLMKYKLRRSIERAEGLAELARLGQECDAACASD